MDISTVACVFVFHFVCQLPSSGFIFISMQLNHLLVRVYMLGRLGAAIKLETGTNLIGREGGC
jgi:hypothetical protein